MTIDILFRMTLDTMQGCVVDEKYFGSEELVQKAYVLREYLKVQDE